MCLIVFAYGVRPDLPLIVASNRDEFYQRPTASAHFWTTRKKGGNENDEDDDSDDLVFAGKDLEAGGTWMGVKIKSGRIAFLTNYREANNQTVPAAPQPSRGALVTDFLHGDKSISALAYLKNLESTTAQLYKGFSLVVGDTSGLYYFSNRRSSSPEPSTILQKLEPGRVYGLCNRGLDDPWPKVLLCKRLFQQTLQEAQSPTHLDELVFEMLQNQSKPTQQDIDLVSKQTGCSYQIEELRSSIFIAAAGDDELEDYGTRSATLIKITNDYQCSIEERSFGKLGNTLGTPIKETFVVRSIPGGREVSAQNRRSLFFGGYHNCNITFWVVVIVMGALTATTGHSQPFLATPTDSLFSRYSFIGPVSLLLPVVVGCCRILPFILTWKGRRLLLAKYRQLTWFEFWPFYAYLPIVVYATYLQYWWYGGKPVFTAVNPAIPASGFFGESKSDILMGLLGRGDDGKEEAKDDHKTSSHDHGSSNPKEQGEDFVAKFRLLPNNNTKDTIHEALEFMKQNDLGFPVVLKPDAGERGKGVEIVHTLDGLRFSLLRRRGTPTLIQAYAPGREFGVFYVRYPNQSRGQIYSITDKRFTKVVGRELAKHVWT